MAIGLNSSGTSTQTVGATELSLQTITAAGVHQLVIDTALLANAATPDILEIRVYLKATAAGTERLADLHSLVGAQSTPFWISKPYGSPFSIRFGITQPQGVARALSWATWTY